MEQTDLVTAFGRLLRDGALRDAYASNPLKTAECLGLRIEDRHVFLSLNPQDLEIQAEVLLRKRFEAVSRLIPQTIANAGGRAWPLFAEYAREVWPTGAPPELDDAKQFCLYLATLNDSPISVRERNCIRFATNDSLFAIHVVADAVVRGRRRYCLQVFVRSSHCAWRELLLYPGL